MFNRIEETAPPSSAQRLRELHTRYTGEEARLLSELESAEVEHDRITRILHLMQSEPSTAIRVFSSFCASRTADLEERQRDLADLRSALAGVDEELEVAERRAAARLENRLRSGMIAGLRLEPDEPPMN